MPGIAGRLKRRRLSPSCKASVLSGAQVPRGREAHLGENEERSSGSHRRTAVERTSGLRGTHHPSRGAAGTEGLCGGSALRSRRAGHQVRAERAGGSASRSSARTTNEVCGSSREGTSHHRKMGEPLLGSVRSHFALLRERGSAARQPVPSPRGGGRRRRRAEVRHLRAQHEESMRLVVGARASSYCRSRQCALGLREA